MTDDIRKKPLYQVLAGKLEWQPPADSRFVRQRDLELGRLIDMLPSGSGWDCGTQIEVMMTRTDRIVLYGSFHHMNEQGFYTNWTDHRIVITPSLQFGFEMRITGTDQNDIKDMLYQWFDDALRREVPEYSQEVADRIKAEEATDGEPVS